MTPLFSFPRARAFRQALQKTVAGVFCWGSKFNENLDTSWEPSYAEKVANMGPTWPPRMEPKSVKKSSKKSMPKSIEKSMPFKFDV